MSRCVHYILGCLLICLTLADASQMRPRRIKFAKCDYAAETSAKPKSVWMTCMNNRGTCDVQAGGTHNLRAIFIPKINGTEIRSYVRWASWVEVPLPGQDENPCDDEMECPITIGDITRFTYTLSLQNFWPRNEYPVVWSLTNTETDEEIMCFKFRINII